MRCLQITKLYLPVWVVLQGFLAKGCLKFISRGGASHAQHGIQIHSCLSLLAQHRSQGSQRLTRQEWNEFCALGHGLGDSTQRHGSYTSFLGRWDNSPPGPSGVPEGFSEVLPGLSKNLPAKRLNQVERTAEYFFTHQYIVKQKIEPSQH